MKGEPHSEWTASTVPMKQSGIKPTTYTVLITRTATFMSAFTRSARHVVSKMAARSETRSHKDSRSTLGVWEVEV